MFGDAQRGATELQVTGHMHVGLIDLQAPPA
jgi:hypothetical protein